MEGKPATLQGNCHCGSHRFELDRTVPLTDVAICDCSLCKKQGFLWLSLPDDALRVVRNDADLVYYKTSSVEQQFCNNCGIAVYGQHHEGKLAGKRLVNVRTLRGINHFDYDRARYEEETSGGPPRVFSVPATGSCHCGKVSVQLLSAPDPFEVKEDNCSICSRNAFIGVYPDKDQVVICGDEHTREYRFGRGFNGNPFCGTCGVHVYLNLYGPPVEVVNRLPAERRAGVEKMLRIKPLNIRTFENVDLNTISVLRSHDGAEGYEAAVLGIQQDASAA